MADRLDARTHDLGDERRGVNGQGQGQCQQLRDQYPATDKVEALQLRHFPMHRRAENQCAQGRDHQEQRQADPELVERYASRFEALGGPAVHQHDGDDGDHDADHKRPEPVGHQRGRHVQATAADEEGVTEVVAVAWSRHGQEHGEVPEQDLQQRRNVTENFHINCRHFGDDPVLRQPCHTDDETEDRRQDHANEGHEQGVEQTDDKHSGIAVRFGVVDQVLSDAETGTALQKVETGGNAPVLKVGLRVVEQKPA
ncbi:hypothetical protein D3C71_1004860 [compost metagenome]